MGLPDPAAAASPGADAGSGRAIERAEHAGPIVVDKEPATPSASSSGRADGAACSTAAECASGVCEGMGCGVDEGRCAAERRPCTRDLKSYCGCDGQTFRASGTCPLRRYRARGPCVDDGAAPR